MNLAWRRCETEGNTWEIGRSAARRQRRQGGEPSECGEAATCSWAAAPGCRRVAEEAKLIKVIQASRTSSAVVCFHCFLFIFRSRIHFYPEIWRLENEETICCSLKEKVLWCEIEMEHAISHGQDKKKKCLFIKMLNLETIKLVRQPAIWNVSQERKRPERQREMQWRCCILLRVV